MRRVNVQIFFAAPCIGVCSAYGIDELVYLQAARDRNQSLLRELLRTAIHQHAGDEQIRVRRNARFGAVGRTLTALSNPDYTIEEKREIKMAKRHVAAYTSRRQGTTTRGRHANSHS
jgi:hypothetical protein